MGFFDKLGLLYYALVVACIVISVRGIVGTIGWLGLAGFFGRVSKGARTAIDEGKRSGNLTWNLD